MDEWCRKEAREKIMKGQLGFLDELEEMLATTRESTTGLTGR
jgi:predicted NUDIX family NTP pyrophosphohydrolase